MSDDLLRSLERACAADPEDKAAYERLQDERVRIGLGWHGESLIYPNRPGCGGMLVTHRQGRNVYEWIFAIENTGSIRGDRCLSIQLVYVPGGELKCQACMPSSIHYLGRTGMSCPVCGGANWHSIKPFYIGRFPVTRKDCHPYTPVSPEIDHLPVVGVSLDEIKRFCEMSRLRLPSEAEWRWAALGNGLPSLDSESASPWATAARTPRRYPWGNEPCDESRCVWRGHRKFGRSYGGQDGSPAPVIDCELCVKGDCYMKMTCAIVGPAFLAPGKPPETRLVPARPAGASWCQAQDMAGNVWEIVSNGRIFGGSFAFGTEDGLDPEVMRGGPGGPDEDVGFRIALSATDDSKKVATPTK